MTIRTIGTSRITSRTVDNSVKTTTVSISTRTAETFSSDLLGAMSPTTETSISTPLASSLLNQTGPINETQYQGVLISFASDAAEPVIEEAVLNARREEETTSTDSPSVSIGSLRGGPSSSSPTTTRTESDATATTENDDEGVDLATALSSSVPLSGSTSAFITSEDSEPGVVGTGEISQGTELLSEEKPRIALILSTHLNSNRIPTETVIFIKRINSIKYRDIAYTILRKNIFTENDFRQIIRIVSNKFSIDPLYTNIANKLFSPEERSSIISFTDRFLQPNSSYAYKIKVEFEILSREEQIQNTLVSSFVQRNSDVFIPFTG